MQRYFWILSVHLLENLVPGMQLFQQLRGIASTIVALALLMIIIREIGLGHKWARTLFLILFILWNISYTIPYFYPV